MATKNLVPRESGSGNLGTTSKPWELPVQEIGMKLVDRLILNRVFIISEL